MLGNIFWFFLSFFHIYKDDNFAIEFQEKLERDQATIENNIDLTGSTFVNATLNHMRASASDNFTNVDFTNADLNTAAFSSSPTSPVSNLTGANFTSANLSNMLGNFTSFNNANFTNANASNACLAASTFVGTIWSNTTCPDGTNSNNNGNTCVGHFPC